MAFQIRQQIARLHALDLERNSTFKVLSARSGTAIPMTWFALKTTI